MSAAATRGAPVRAGAGPPTPVALATGLAAGGLLAAQARVNGTLGEYLGSPLAAALVSFSVGLVAVAGLVAALPRTRRAVRPAVAAPLPWWTYLGGLGGATMVAVAAAAAPVIGVATFTVGFVAGQAVGGLVVDRSRLGPGDPRPLSARRVTGAALAVAAVAVVRLGHDAGGPAAGTALWLLLASAATGVLAAVQQALNGRVQRATGEPLLTTLVNFAVGTTGLVVVTAVVLGAAGVPGSPPAQPLLYAGGLLGDRRDRDGRVDGAPARGAAAGPDHRGRAARRRGADRRGQPGPDRRRGHRHRRRRAAHPAGGGAVRADPAVALRGRRGHDGHVSSPVGRPADPDRPATVGGVVRARPVRLRRVAIAVAAAVVLTFVVIAVLLGNTRSEGVVFGIGDQVAMVVLGVLVAAGVLLLARPSVVADTRGLRVRNIVTSHDVPWEVVREVAFRDGSPWAVLELADDDQLALLAVQAADGDRSVAAVRGLRALQARHAAGDREDPPAGGRSAGVS